MRDMRGISFDQQHAHRGSHPGVNGIVHCFPPDAGARLIHRVTQTFSQHVGGIAHVTVEARLVGIAPAVQQLAERIHRDARRDLSGRVPAHSVRDDKESSVLVYEEAVFVVFPHRAGICPCAGFQLHEGSPRVG